MTTNLSSVTQEARRILFETILQDARLAIPPAILEAATTISFTCGDDEPFLPSPCKMTESASALYGLIAAGASAVAAHRFGIGYQDIKVNTDVASLSLFSVVLPTIANVPFMENEKVREEIDKGDLHGLYTPLHAACTGLYRTKDERWYYSHGDLNPRRAMEMLGVDDSGDVSPEESYQAYANKIAQWDAQTLEEKANSQYHISGCECLSHDEFVASETGKHMSEEPLYKLTPVEAPRSDWPFASARSALDCRPLAGIKVIDFSRVIAAPVISKILAVLGAEVLKISYKRLSDHGFLWVDLSAGKRDANVDLKSAAGREILSALIKDADVLIDGFRPGVLDRLNLNTQTLRMINPRLVIVRENCYGWKGPLAHRSGWQPISDCLVGHSHLQGQFLGLDEPVLPPLPNSDMQTGLAGAAATIQALYMRTQRDVTFDVNVSLTQYNMWFYELGQYTVSQQSTLRERNATFHARHSDSVVELLSKTHQAVLQTRPDVFQHPEYFWRMDGREWGIDEDIMILAPAFELGRSKLLYQVPSGRRGRSAPAWTGS